MLREAGRTCAKADVRACGDDELLAAVVDLDALFRRYTQVHAVCPDPSVPSRATLRALALIELVRGATDQANLVGSRAP